MSSAQPEDGVPEMLRRRLSRRELAAFTMASIVAVGFPWIDVAGQEADPENLRALAEVPSHGAARSGPVQSGAPLAAGGSDSEEGDRQQGIAPVAIQIDNAGVDAPIERADILDGVMQNPSGPWVVSWYDGLATPGEKNNTVMAGHVDYWDVGPAVFQKLEQLNPGDIIRIVGEDGTVFEYAIDWMKNFVVANLSPEKLDEIVGDAEEEILTLVTCKIGSFDAAIGEYRERFVVRATGLA